MWRLSLAGMTLGFVAACATPDAPEGTRSAGSAIQDGADDSVHSFAVGVCGGTPGACTLQCSGVLVAPNLVVTARHCLEVANDPNVVCPTSQFAAALTPPTYFNVTTSPSMLQATAGWHPVSQLWTLDDASVCGGDVALLLLGDVIAPSEAVPAVPNVFAPLTDESSFEAAFVAIGYGLSSPLVASGTSGIRRIKEDVALLCIPGDPDVSLACAANLASSVGPNEFVSGPAVCPGDSGSGAFAQEQFDDGTFLVLGVLSRGNTDPSDPSQCAAGVYTRLDPWSAFLRQGGVQAAQIGGYPPPFWTAGDAGLPGGPLVADASPSDDGGLPDAALAGGASPASVVALGGCGVAGARAAGRSADGNDGVRGAVFLLLGSAAGLRRRRRLAHHLS